MVGVYQGEVPGVHQPDYPDSADYVSVVMQSAFGCRTGQGSTASRSRRCSG